MKSKLRAMFGISKISFLEIFAFRASIISILFSTIIIIIMQYFLWKNIYSFNQEMQGYNLNEIITYSVIAILLNSILNTPRRIPIIITAEVRNGGIASKLTKPVSYYFYYVWYSIGRGVYFCFAIAIPLGIISYITMNLNKCSNIFFFILSAFLGFLIELSLSLLLSVASLRNVESKGVRSLNTFFSYFLSGRLIPIAFFPILMKKLSEFLPYQYIVYGPIQIYLGKGNPIQIILFQIAWVLSFIFIGNILFNRALKKIEIAGG